MTILSRNKIIFSRIVITLCKYCINFFTVVLYRSYRGRGESEAFSGIRDERERKEITLRERLLFIVDRIIENGGKNYGRGDNIRI
jgi:hypothetical protein